MFSITVGKMTSGVNNDSMCKNSSSLKDLSMSEILKLAEDRARVKGIGRQSTDNPWHKRMAISENITRRQAPQTTSRNPQEVIGLTTVDNESDNNEKFFENLMKKMTMEQFMPNGKASRLKKRTCLWNKENSSTVKKIKHLKDSRISTKLIPPSTEFLTRLIMPRRKDNNSPGGAKIQSRYETNELHREQAIPHHKSTPDPTRKDMSTQATNSHCTDYDSTTASTVSINESFHGYQTSNDCIPDCSQETLKLAHNRSINRIDCVSTCSQETLKLPRNLAADKIDYYDPLHEVSPSRYYAKKSPNNFWNSPRLSTIAECRELSMRVESTVLHDIDMEFDLSQPPTPPLSTELDDCEACQFDQEECADNVTNNYSQLSPLMLLGDSDTEIPVILVENLST